MSEIDRQLQARRAGRSLPNLLRDDDIGCSHSCLCSDAADEIERLAKALDRERRRGDRLAAKFADVFRNERRDWLGEIRSLAHVKGYVMVRRPGRTTHVVSQKEWDCWRPFPGTRASDHPNKETAR